MTTVQKYNFTGTTAECFRDFVERFDDFDDQRVIAQVLGVSYSSTFRVWVRNGLVTKGEKLIRIRVLMELFGYHVIEWQNQLPALQVVAKAIAFDVRTPSQAFDDLGYKNINDLYRVLLTDQSSMLPERQEMAAWYAQELRTQIYTRRDSVIALIKSKSSKLARALANQGSDNQTVDQLPVAIFSSEHDVVTFIEIFGGLVDAILPLVELFVSDDVSPDQRKAMRSHIGRGRLAMLNGRLEALTSEQNRDHFLRMQGKERIGS